MSWVIEVKPEGWNGWLALDAIGRKTRDQAATYETVDACKAALLGPAGVFLTTSFVRFCHLQTGEHVMWDLGAT